MKKKGFTLIELIAVITLLALIVVITVPVIINTLSNTEQKEYEDFKKIIMNAAELYVERNRDLYPELNEIGGAIDINADTLVNEGYLKSDLTSPIDDNSVTNYKIVVYSDKDSIFNYNIYERNNLVEISTVSSQQGVIKIDECAVEGKCAVGTPFMIKVNDTETYKFYVINDDEETVTLIMNRNLYEKGKASVAWSTESQSLGPITALNYLNSQTTTWTNIKPIKEYIYNNFSVSGETSGYQKFEIQNGVGKLISQDGSIITQLEGTSRARMITGKEAREIGCIHAASTCPSWLYENLYNSGDNNSWGYWTLTTLRDYAATNINTGGLYSNCSVSYDRGVRPVIEISRH